MNAEPNPNLEAQILETLKACYDPGNPFAQPANIVELGSIEALTLTLDKEAPGAGIPGVPPRFRLALTMLPTSENEDARAQLQAQVLNGLAGLEQLSHTDLRYEEGWTEARVTPQGRKRLKLDPAPFAILNNRR